LDLQRRRPPTDPERTVIGISPEQLKRRRFAYLRACLRHDLQPADLVTRNLISELQQAHARKDQQQEQQAWRNLIKYLTTLERPNENCAYLDYD
jgi:hypothetical protein